MRQSNEFDKAGFVTTYVVDTTFLDERSISEFAARFLAAQCDVVCPSLKQYLHSVANSTGQTTALLGSALALSA
jgi:hypothetical protein